MDNYDRHVINIVFLNVCVGGADLSGEKKYIFANLSKILIRGRGSI